MAHIEGPGGAYCMGIPPSGSPSASRCPSDPNPHPHIPFDGEEGVCAGIVGICHLVSSQ
jgi:hypothetical protein